MNVADARDLTTVGLVDPEIAPMLDLVSGITLGREVLASIRASLDNRPDLLEPEIPARIMMAAGWEGAPPVPVLMFDPPGRTARGAILHMHGGGMVMGRAAMNSVANAGLAARLGVLVASVDYRLAPECSFPAPQDDCYAALAWLRAHADALGIDSDRIIVAGESAGGGLAAGLAHMVRDRGDPALCGQILTYPMLDHRTGSPESPYRNAMSGEFIWTAAANRFGWDCLKGDYAANDDRIGWFSPARAVTLAGVAPAFIATGALDLFVDENIAYASRLVAAGVPTELHVYPGAIHGFGIMAASRLARQYRADIERAAVTMLGLTHS